jgi:phospholipase C
MAPPSAWRAALLVLLLSGVARPASQPAWPISQVVVIMFENRSFDHMCGYLKQLNPDIDGLSGNESNPVKPADPTSPNVTVRVAARAS